MVTHRYNIETSRQGRAPPKRECPSGAKPTLRSRVSGGRVQKRPIRTDGTWKKVKTQVSDHARDGGQPSAVPGVQRTKPNIHACCELSLAFVTQARLQTDVDTNTIALNLMDHFLFSDSNWLPELSYCNLHAACFLFASLVTGKANTVEEIARSLRPDAAFVQLMASPLVDDEDSAAAIANTISVDTTDVKRGYTLLYERADELTRSIGEYAPNLKNLPSPTSLIKEEVDNGIEEENFDIFEEPAEAR